MTEQFDKFLEDITAAYAEATTRKRSPHEHEYVFVHWCEWEEPEECACEEAYFQCQVCGKPKDKE